MELNRNIFIRQRNIIIKEIEEQIDILDKDQDTSLWVFSKMESDIHDLIKDVKQINRNLVRLMTEQGNLKNLTYETDQKYLNYKYIAVYKQLDKIKSKIDNKNKNNQKVHNSQNSSTNLEKSQDDKAQSQGWKITKVESKQENENELSKRLKNIKLVDKNVVVCPTNTVNYEKDCVSVDNIRGHLVCWFCGGSHIAALCEKYSNVRKRHDKLVDKGVCTLCLKPKHRPYSCNILVICKMCQNKGHNNLFCKHTLLKLKTNQGKDIEEIMNRNYSGKIYI